MNFDHEPWRPLFIREPVERRTWSLIARALRAYLLQVAEHDGRLLKCCADPSELATTLSAHPEEMDLVRGAISVLLREGFLRWAGEPEHPGWLGVDRLFTYPQPARDGSASAPASEGDRQRRQRDQARDRQRRKRDKARDSKSVTDVTEERDQRDLPPQSPPSVKEINKNSGDARVSAVRDGERDRQRDAQRVMGDGGATGNGHIQPQLAHRRFAEQHRLNLDDFLTRLRRDPRSAKRSTVEGWEALTRMLERAVGTNESVGAERDADPSGSRWSDAAAQREPPIAASK